MFTRKIIYQNGHIFESIFNQLTVHRYIPIVYI